MTSYHPKDVFDFIQEYTDEHVSGDTLNGTAARRLGFIVRVRLELAIDVERSTVRVVGIDKTLRCSQQFNCIL